MRAKIFANTVFGIGILPAPAFGLSLGTGFQWRRFSLSAEGRFAGTPNFSVSADRSAISLLILGIISGCYQAPLPRPFYSFEGCPFIGAGRLYVEPQPKGKEDTLFGVAEAHPFTMMFGLRVPFAWQISRTKAPDFYLKVFAELDGGILRAI